jgi:hypothetical protein
MTRYRISTPNPTKKKTPEISDHSTYAISFFPNSISLGFLLSCCIQRYPGLRWLSAMPEVSLMGVLRTVMEGMESKRAFWVCLLAVRWQQHMVTTQQRSSIVEKGFTFEWRELFFFQLGY